MTTKYRFLGFFLVGLSSGCRPLIDGGWQGSAECSDTGTHPLSALLNEQNDGDLKGTFFFEEIDFLGANLTLRGDVDNGEFDPNDNEYNFDLQTDGDNDADFSGSLSIDDQDPNEADGDLDQFANNGNVDQTCTFKLDRISVAD